MTAPNDLPPSPPPPGLLTVIASSALAAGLPLLMVRREIVPALVAWVVLIGFSLLLRRLRGPRSIVENAVVVLILSFLVATTMLGVSEIRVRRLGAGTTDGGPAATDAARP